MKFESIKNTKLLSDLLATSEESLVNFLEIDRQVYDAAPRNKQSSLSIELDNFNGVVSAPITRDYDLIRMYIPKKNKSRGGYRVVYKIENERLNNIIKTIYLHLVRSYNPIDCVHGFVKGKSVATNAISHLGKRRILKLDIKDFFPSIQKEYVKAAFVKLGANIPIAEMLTKLVTLNGELVQGFNTSPVLANILFEEIDLSLQLIAEQYNCIYTRYADDLYFSTDKELFPPISDIKEILNKSNFQLKEDKTKIMIRGQKQYVTGLTVFDDQIPRVPKWMKNKIRFSLYYMVKFGSNECSIMFGRHNDNYIILSREKLKGWIDYVNAVEPILAGKYQKEFDKIRP